MLYNVIAYRKDTKEWFVCKIEGRMLSPELKELIEKEPEYMKLYDKMELEGEYFVYYKFKGCSPKGID
jgi:hypothetical protein